MQDSRFKRKKNQNKQQHTLSVSLCKVNTWSDVLTCKKKPNYFSKDKGESMSMKNIGIQS